MSATASTSPTCCAAPTAKAAGCATRTSATSPTSPRRPSLRSAGYLAGEALVSAEDRFGIARSPPHGRVAAVLGTLRALDLERLISPAGSGPRGGSYLPAAPLARIKALGHQALLPEDAFRAVRARRSWGGGAPRGHRLASCPPGADRAGAGPPSSKTGR